MPGYVTHVKVLYDSIKILSTKKKKNHLLKSILALFSTPERLGAAFFGSYGIDIFHQLPFIKKSNLFGNSFTFDLHDGGSAKLLRAMGDALFAHSDFNTEWVSMQRAYFYGMLSHQVADSVLFPYIFYFSGFPDSNDLSEIRYFREQNLLFQYSIDNCLLYFDDNANEIKKIYGTIQIPTSGRLHEKKLCKPLKSILLESLKHTYPQIYKKNIWYHSAKDEHAIPLGYLDTLHLFIPMMRKYKHTENATLRDFIKWMRRKKMYADFLVLYPRPRFTNKDVMNLHRERWQYPCGLPGYRYESVINLITIAAEKTVELWELYESCLYEKKMNATLYESLVNSFTGVKDAKYNDMRMKSPIKLIP